jgi:predicted lipoprotein
MALTRRHILVLCSAAALGGSAATLGGCKIVANADLKAAKAKSSDEFDANAYVDKLWTAKVLPDFRSRAVDLDALLQQVAQDPDKAGQAHGHRAGDGNPWTFEIKGEGKITAVDAASRHAIVSVEVQTASGARKVDLQVGPVVFGTALRDALSFIQFGDFVNQIQYAQVSRALNDRASRDVRESFDFKDAVGKTVVFYAAAVLSGDTISATPVIIEQAKGGKT